MEQAAKYDVITNWSCDKGHEFWSTAQFVEDVIDKDLCPCCMKLREEPIDGLALDALPSKASSSGICHGPKIERLFLYIVLLFSLYSVVSKYHQSPIQNKSGIAQIF